MLRGMTAAAFVLSYPLLYHTQTAHTSPELFFITCLPSFQEVPSKLKFMDRMEERKRVNEAERQGALVWNAFLGCFDVRFSLLQSFGCSIHNIGP
jgi:hypothetical protein